LTGDDRPVVLAGVAVLTVSLFALVVLDGRAPTGPTSALLLAAVLFVLSTPLLALVAGRDGDQSLFGFLLIALAAKLGGAFGRYYLTNAAYGGLADAVLYDTAGREWVAELKSGQLVWVADSVSNFGAGTKAMGTLTGIVYTIGGRNVLSGFVMFSFLGFWGLVMAYRAMRVGVPDGDHRRYRLLLFFLPSLVFWPSSIGKDAWMQFSLGAVFLGVAWLTRERPSWTGIPWLMLGLSCAALLRPHIALAALAPMAAALAIRTRSTRAAAAPARGGVVRMAGIAILGIASILLLNRLGAVFGGSGDAAAGSVTGVLDKASNITSQGGSEFEATEVTGIADLPMATISVLFRPFLWEATSAVKAIAGLETTLLLVLTIASWRRLRGLPAQIRRHRYVAYVAIFALVSIVGFSRVGNEGILARQRTQFLPAVVVLLCLPVRKDDEDEARAEPPNRAATSPRLGTVVGEGSTMQLLHHTSAGPPAPQGADALGHHRPSAPTRPSAT
jgi:hypothetical protein